MRILIDARMVTARNFGIGRYVYNLLAALLELDRANSYSLIVNDDYLADLVKSAPNFSLIKAKARWLSLREQFEIPRIVKRVRPDLFHAASFVVPFVQSCPTVATIYDLIHVIFPEHYSLLHKIYYNLFLKMTIKKVCRLITISESSRNDIAEYYGYPADRISIAYPAVGPLFRPVDDQAAISAFRSKYDLPDKLILYVGNRKKHKNVAGLVKAYALLPDRIKAQYALVLSGTSDPALDDLARGQKVADRVRYLGNIPDEELPLAYNAAELFVFPTLYEGFGMPPLEAMACGIPVVTSNVASIPEVVGDAAVLVDPTKTSQLADAMARVLGNNELKAQLRSRALEQAERFTWKACAQNTLKAYQEALA